MTEVFAGENLEVDDFMKIVGLLEEKRDENIAHNPYPAVKIFYFTIRMTLHTLLGFKVMPYQVKMLVRTLSRKPNHRA